MITQTFRILPGIGPSRERRIRRTGLKSWEDFLRAGGVRFASPRLNARWCGILRQWREAVDKRDEGYFFRSLPAAEHWRLFRLFYHDVACVDIETTGLAPPDDEITVVGIYRPGRGLIQLVNGVDLNGDGLDAAFDGVKLLISFAGAAFDIPYIKREFSYLRLDVPHYDLCYAARRLDIKGGLKKVEKQFGVGREADVDGLDGWAAVKLWRAHLSGREGALELLKRYNAADTVNLFGLAEILYCMMAAGELEGSGPVTTQEVTA